MPSLLQRLAVLVVLAATAAHGYIPAVAVNDTTSLLNSHDFLYLAWANTNLPSIAVSRQFVAVTEGPSPAPNVTVAIVPWTKYAKGVLVHFNEEVANQDASVVPWIAMISCDSNGTIFSMTDDIFKLARNRGAQAALLYSVYSQGCMMNSEYLTGPFERSLDVYTTWDVQTARVIENQFSLNVASSAYYFDSATLNNSAQAAGVLLAQNSLSVVGGDIFTTESSPPTATLSDTTSVTDSLSTTLMMSTTISPSQRQRYKRQATTTISALTTTSTAPSVAYLGAVLAAQNITVGTANATSTATTSSGGGGPNTGLAMIILYAITGVVTFMFLIVILSGAIRAIRHPERYGPRGGVQHGNRPPQSRAGGLTRAILDTFPVVKFGRTADDDAHDRRETTETTRDADLESGKAVELDTLEHPTTIAAEGQTEARVDKATEERRHSGSSSSFVSAREGPLPVAADGAAIPDVNPADVDHGTTCPICVCEFEKGEDVRILPCDARHRFHQACIDPWLLQVSSLCPLCRLDLSGPKEETVLEEEPSGQEAMTGEQQVLSNLRAMLQGHSRGSTSGSASATAAVGGHRRDSTAGTTGPSARLNFFRYVARRRQAAAAAASAGPAPAASPGEARSP